jgi:hypothetical protein
VSLSGQKNQSADSLSHGRSLMWLGENSIVLVVARLAGFHVSVAEHGLPLEPSRIRCYDTNVVRA